MDILEQQTIEGRLRQPNSEQFCPECGAIKTEADRLVEGRVLFVWCTCCRVGVTDSGSENS